MKGWDRVKSSPSLFSSRSPMRLPGRRRAPAGTNPVSNVTKVVALLLVAVSVGLDNFGASTAIGVSGVDRSLRLRVALIFGVFEAAMPLIGLLLGRSLAQYLGSVAKPLGGGLLVLAGTYAICTELFGGDRETAENAELSMRRLVLIGVALSIDNLVIGFALGAYHVNIVIAAVIIATISVALSLLGLEIGSRLGDRLGQRAELVGGAVLILVGLAIGTGLL
jgi:manganese efflux pump family protein